jgi:hypothetical protein
VDPSRTRVRTLELNGVYLPLSPSVVEQAHLDAVDELRTAMGELLLTNTGRIVSGKRASAALAELMALAAFADAAAAAAAATTATSMDWAWGSMRAEDHVRELPRQSTANGGGGDGDPNEACNSLAPFGVQLRRLHLAEQAKAGNTILPPSSKPKMEKKEHAFVRLTARRVHCA